MATVGSVQDPNMCAVCLESDRALKFLNCHHSFCSDCIEDIASHHLGGQFPCPSCRKLTTMPSGGVAALQTNFYLQPTQPQMAQPQMAQPQIAQPQITQPLPAVGNLCTIHPGKTLEFYCTRCDQALCMNCKLTKHEGHVTDDLYTVVWARKTELRSHVERIERAVTKLMTKMDSCHEERQALQLQMMKSAVEKEIKHRHTLAVAAADRWREEVMATLQSVDDEINEEGASHLTQQQGRLDTLLDIQRTLQDAVHSDTAPDVLAVAKEMRTGRGSQSQVDKLTSHEFAVSHPVLHFNVDADVMLEKTRDCLGHVTRVEVTLENMTVVGRFTCTTDPGIDIFSLCHIDADPPVVLVSYDNRAPLQQDLPRKAFTEEGKCVSIGSGKSVGKLTFKRYAKGRSMYPTLRPGWFRTYNKSLTAAHFFLDTNTAGQGDVQIDKVLSTHPLKTEEKEEFSINVGQHRAFDVDETEQWFAVLEESQLRDGRRKVQLYQRSVQDPVDTYRSPTPVYQPSDVCFYRLRGRTVLLVTDELNDAVHVVRVEGGRMAFVRYLCAGYPLLQQPTALNVDVSGRLWLACRGGTVLTLQEAA